jgi:hypothetical protein
MRVRPDEAWRTWLEPFVTFAAIFRLEGPGLISRDRTACLKIGQRVKIGREGESENEGQHDQSKTFEHFLSPDRVQASKIIALIDVRGAVCAVGTVPSRHQEPNARGEAAPGGRLVRASPARPVEGGADALAIQTIHG